MALLDGAVAAAATREHDGGAASLDAMRLLWLGPVLLLRRPRDTQGVTREGPGAEASNFSLLRTVRRRANLADAGRWEQLLDDYLADLAWAAERSARAAGSQRDLGERAARLEALDAAARKTYGGCLRSAIQLLTGNGKAPAGPATTAKIRDLVAVSVTEEQRRETQRACQAAAAVTRTAPAAKLRDVRRKVRVLKRGAEPGPSAWRNSFIVLVAERPNGVASLTRWVRLWNEGGHAAGGGCIVG